MRVTAPEPFGMSGGAIFGVPLDKKNHRGEPATEADRDHDRRRKQNGVSGIGMVCSRQSRENGP